MLFDYAIQHFWSQVKY